MSPPCSGGYWDEVRCRIDQPGWLADVGFPLFVALLGLALAVLLLRRQLRHDRELRRADRLSQHVATFGQQVVGVIDGIWNRRGDDPYWDAQDWDGWSTIFRAQRKVSAALADPSAFEEVVAGARDVSWAWRACVARRRELESQGMVIDTVKAGLGIDTALNDLWNQLRRAGEELSRWDGLSDMPDFKPWPTPHVPLPVRDRREAHQRWMTYYADAFEQYVRRSGGSPQAKSSR